jgi:hypothetical protein
MLQDVYTTNKKVSLDDPLTSDGFLATNMHGSHTKLDVQQFNLDGGRTKAPKGLLRKGSVSRHLH